VKKLFWFLTTSILLLATFATPSRLTADGNPMPVCPDGKSSCKPGIPAFEQQPG